MDSRSKTMANGSGDNARAKRACFVAGHQPASVCAVPFRCGSLWRVHEGRPDSSITYLVEAMTGAPAPTPPFQPSALPPGSCPSERLWAVLHFGVRRGLAPVDGFLEWRKDTKPSSPISSTCGAATSSPLRASRRTRATPPPKHGSGASQSSPPTRTASSRRFTIECQRSSARRITGARAISTPPRRPHIASLCRARFGKTARTIVAKDRNYRQGGFDVHTTGAIA
jgi:hypothetical protein